MQIFLSQNKVYIYSDLAEFVKLIRTKMDRLIETAPIIPKHVIILNDTITDSACSFIPEISTVADEIIIDTQETEEVQETPTNHNIVLESRFFEMNDNEENSLTFIPTKRTSSDLFNKFSYSSLKRLSNMNDS
jgi:hypothetical protein